MNDTQPPDPLASIVPSDDLDAPFHMKPLLAIAVEEAVRWAIVDSTFGGWIDTYIAEHGIEKYLDDAESLRRSWVANPDLIPESEMALLSWEVLAQNLANRLFGSGGWMVNGLYAGNASPQQVLDALVTWPQKDPLGEITAMLGLVEPDDPEARGGGL